MSRTAAQVRFETAAVLRNGEQLLLTFVLPALALALLSRVPVLPAGDRPELALAGVLTMAALSTGFTSQAIAVAFDRRWGVLRLLATTPLGRRGLLAGKVGAVVLVLLAQVVVLTLEAVLLGWAPAPWVLTGLPLLVLGAAAFTALGMLVGGTLRAEAVLALANLLWVVLVAGGAVLLPAGMLPAGLGAVVVWLPTGALGEGLRALAAGGGFPWVDAAVLGGWTALLSWAAARAFRWD